LPDSKRELKRLDRDVLLMTAVLWLAHFGILSTRSQALGIDEGGLEIAVRFGVSVIGAGSCVGVYYLLRRRVMRPMTRFAWAVALCAPCCFLLAAGGEVVWLICTPYYEKKYGLELSDLFGPHRFKILKEMVYSAVFFLWVYVSWCALYVGSVVAAELRDRDARLALAESAAHQAQLLALRFQLNPHFLFNTLNTLSGLIALDRKRQAEDVVLNLSEFLRYSLAGEPEQFVTLAKEIEAQRMYLDIERVRFADRLKVRFEVERGCEEAFVPAFLLQPLIENAIKHAVAPSEAPVTLTVGAEREDGQLVIRVENSASTDPPAAKPRGFGIGIANVRNRLDALFGAKASFEAAPTAAKGWVNRIALPWMERPADARPDR
jgi:hypothetical protein